MAEMRRPNIKVGDIVMLRDGADPFEAKIKAMTQYKIQSAVKTPKGRWGTKTTESSRQRFWQYRDAAADVSSPV